MKKAFTLVFFFSFMYSEVYAQRNDVVYPSYSTGNSNVSTVNSNNSNNISSGSTNYNQSNYSTSNSNASSTNNNNSSGSANYNQSQNTSNDRDDRNLNNSNPNNNYNNGNTRTENSYYNNGKNAPNESYRTVYRPPAFYIRIGLGYAFPNAGQTLNENSDPYSATMRFDTTRIINSYTKMNKISFSSGLQAVGAFGLMVTRNIGIEIDGYIGIAPKKYTANFYDVMVNGSYPANITVTNKAISPIFIAPCLLLQTNGRRCNVYARSGPVIAVNGKVQREETYNFSSPGYESYINQLIIGTKITTSLNIGYTAATGIQYRLNNRLSLWSELNVLSMSMYIKQELNTENIADGQSAQLFPTVNYGFSGSGVNRNNQRGTQPTYAEPFSNISVNAGLCLNIH